MAYNTDEQLEHLVKNTLRDEEIQKGITEARLSDNEVVNFVMKNKEAIWNSVISEIEEYNLATEWIRSFKHSYPALYNLEMGFKEAHKKSDIFLTISLILLCFALTLTPLFLGNGYSGWVNRLLYDKFMNTGWKILLGLILFSILFISSYNLSKYIRTIYLNLRDSQEAKVLRENNKDTLQTFKVNRERLVNLNLLIAKNLQEKSIKDMIRAIVNERLVPSYELVFKDIQVSGLSEVLDVNRNIDTKAKLRLDFLLKQMPGGSIGIAGSRGAGKSTLIQSYCGATRVVKQISGLNIIPVMSSAPVEYDTREFILHLFATTCENALKEERLNHKEIYDEKKIKVSQERLPQFLSYIFPNIIWLVLLMGMSCFYGSICIYYLYSKYHQDEIVKPATFIIVPGAFPNNTDTSVLKQKIATAKGIDLGKALVGQKDSTLPGYINFYLKAMGSSGTLAVKLVNWGVILMVLGIYSFFVQRRNRVINEALLIRKYRRMAKYNREKSDGNRISIKEEAEAWLEKIKFQQTYTNGWSGTLKFPIGIEGIRNKVTTKAEKPLTNPEIVQGFLRFLNILSLEYQVIIGIDELDKMESEDQARKFLNEIKAIFGVQRCFFLISVSESAMNSFERRGLPFRDVFDSSFDSIVYVDYLDLETCKLLLQRRVIGRPVPFFCLAYCFAGGLPRDIIRHFRDIVRISTENESLQEILISMIFEDIQSKIRAVSYSLRKLDTILETDEVFSLLYGLQGREFSSSNLEECINALLAIWLKLKRRKNLNDLELKNNISLLTITEELATYLGYLSTLFELFSKDICTKKLERLDKAGNFDQLVKARQAFSVDYSISRKIIRECRKSEKMNKLSL